MRTFFLIVGSTLAASCITNEIGYINQALLPHHVSLVSGDGTRISAYLYRPQQADPAPAVVMLHGCSGLLTRKYRRLKARSVAWRDIFLAEGYVVLLLDSFTDRGYKTICNFQLSDRPIEPHRERPHDAYGALHWLSAQSFVEPNKIALGGWSNGAMSMLWTIYSNAPQRPKDLEHDFRAAFGFYPGCIRLRKSVTDYTAAIPTLLQLGSDDNWTWPKPCQTLGKEATKRGGAPIIIDTYKGAAHAFDHPNLKPRTIMTSNNRKVRLGTQLEARAKAVERIKWYLRKEFNY